MANAERFEPGAKLLRAFASRRAVADETDLTEHALQSLAPGDLSHFKHTLQSFKPSAQIRRPQREDRSDRAYRPKVVRQKTPSDRRPEENRDLRAVPPAERADAPEEGRELARNQHEEGEPCAQWVHLPSLEPNVLERLSGIPIEPGSRPVVTLARGEVALGNPCAGAVTGGR